MAGGGLAERMVGVARRRARLALDSRSGASKVVQEGPQRWKQTKLMESNLLLRQEALGASLQTAEQLAYRTVSLPSEAQRSAHNTQQLATWADDATYFHTAHAAQQATSARGWAMQSLNAASPAHKRSGCIAMCWRGPSTAGLIRC